MDRQKEKAVLEAILFTMGESVETDRLAAVIEEDKATTRQILMEMKEEYEEKEGGVTFPESLHLSAKEKGSKKQDYIRCLWRYR